MSIHFKELIEDNSLKSVFSLDSIWDNRDGLTHKYSIFLYPDSISYCSRINPIFSFEIEKHLSSFKIISLRDGVYPLLRFFYMNPSPISADQVIIIDERLSSLVPDKWNKNVFLRKKFIKERIFPASSNECLLLVPIGKDNLPLDILKLELEKKSHLIKESSCVSIFFSSCVKVGEEHISEDTAWRFIVLQKILEAFPDIKFNILNWHELERKKLNGLKILEINPLNFYFTDSFLAHELFQKGAVPAEELSLCTNKAHQEHISIHHGFYIYPILADNKCRYNLDEIRKIFGETINVDVEPDNYKDLRLTVSSFQSFCSDMARQIYFEAEK